MQAMMRPRGVALLEGCCVASFDKISTQKRRTEEMAQLRALPRTLCAGITGLRQRPGEQGNLDWTVDFPSRYLAGIVAALYQSSCRQKAVLLAGAMCN
jgi:hypothetical protein